MKLLLSLLIVIGSATSVMASETSLEVLEEINLARTCPQQYAGLITERMGTPRSAEGCKSLAEAVSFLKKVRPLPPLDFSDGLMLGAQVHVTDQGSRGATGHAGSDHSRPWDRMARFGHWIGGAGENISYGYSDAKKIVATLIVDQGVPGRGHRKNIFSPNFSVAGVACGGHARFGSMCVIDFAGGFAEPGEPQLASANRSWTAFGSLRTP